jgi:type VI protein secretion system component Hcp
MKSKHFGAGALCAVLAAAIAVAPPALARDKSKPQIKDISVTKQVGVATPTMARKKLYTSSGAKHQYMEYKMKDVTVTSTSRSSGGPKGSQAPQATTKRK